MARRARNVAALERAARAQAAGAEHHAAKRDHRVSEPSRGAGPSCSGAGAGARVEVAFAVAVTLARPAAAVAFALARTAAVAREASEEPVALALAATAVPRVATAAESVARAVAREGPGAVGLAARQSSAPAQGATAAPVAVEGIIVLSVYNTTLHNQLLFFGERRGGPSCRRAAASATAW